MEYLTFTIDVLLVLDRAEFKLYTDKILIEPLNEIGFDDLEITLKIINKEETKSAVERELIFNTTQNFMGLTCVHIF
ncbi:hypothetical protein ESY86_15715 [Subsaximicrobium wynnwilliamsii]|uniref:Uncharacterized protein n=1 Tax=Subsaximicrobium wynnwilliamsii TaxID=291179 RepID=A0A5C6ZD31_9FLAO|nr:hypothetical protein [Subsaximicrobium wynnwilliamsii]TXD82112.1 hypothetical protein ESY87_15305 [Subsaximicrobium wynnwilliamsii]TXD87757.1 hypothetical protein ESY86_15715 [Subsaximicrobium wynnwilliamsii]TXE01568.1 hypothetical protein ESY88_15295 [Subsaximicrobium wynnwilliamsii]